MGKCPICSKKYDDTVSYCIKCEVGIVPDLNQVINASSEDNESIDIGEDKKTNSFIEVYKTNDAPLAALIKDFLEDHDIVCYVDGYHSQSLNIAIPFHAGSYGMKVMVYKENLKEAEEIIENFFKK